MSWAASPLPTVAPPMWSPCGWLMTTVFGMPGTLVGWTRSAYRVGDPFCAGLEAPAQMTRTCIVGRRAMAVQDNKNLVRQYFEEIWNRGDLDAIDRLFSPDFVRHGPALEGGDLRGPEGMKQLVRMYRTSFPDLKVPIEDQVAEGDVVVSRWTANGSHQGDLMGTPPSGKRATVPGVLIDR